MSHVNKYETQELHKGESEKSKNGQITLLIHLGSLTAYILRILFTGLCRVSAKSCGHKNPTELNKSFWLFSNNYNPCTICLRKQLTLKLKLLWRIPL